MSHIINSQLLEEANYYRNDAFIGTYMATLLDQDLKDNDLEGLQRHLQECRAADFDSNYRPESSRLMTGDELAEMRSSDDY